MIPYKLAMLKTQALFSKVPDSRMENQRLPVNVSDDHDHTVPPTAYVTASSSLTNELNVSINISFNEPCTGGGGFGCSSVNACNLLVYGDGQVIPSSLITLQPGLRYSLLVGLSSTFQYGRAILVMDKSFCTDTAGNKFIRMENSSFVVHFG
ncbi:hypothetical protein LWI29_007506 [Acer saccharum]|uniref:Uncharacterized protein n=1 Tax=Acer saccharum TaxID=4024 RepID=A0AA39RKY7_ACESA|nr:hypothetical protein LWI29_007506 [Acer saccharum]